LTPNLNLIIHVEGKLNLLAYPTELPEILAKIEVISSKVARDIFILGYHF
jgi:hypothetical protein